MRCYSTLAIDRSLQWITRSGFLGHPQGQPQGFWGHHCVLSASITLPHCSSKSWAICRSGKCCFSTSQPHLLISASQFCQTDGWIWYLISGLIYISLIALDLEDLSTCLWSFVCYPLNCFLILFAHFSIGFFLLICRNCLSIRCLCLTIYAGNSFLHQFSTLFSRLFASGTKCNLCYLLHVCTYKRLFLDSVT